MAKFHQMRSCHAFMNMKGEKSDNYLYSGDCVKEGNNTDLLEDYPPAVVNEVQLLLGDNTSVLYQTEEVVIQELKYRPGAALLLDWTINVPSFAIIVGLYVHDFKKIAMCRMLETQEFQWICNAYKVTETNQHKVCLITKLKNRWPLPVYEVDDNSYYEQILSLWTRILLNDIYTNIPIEHFY